MTELYRCLFLVAVLAAPSAFALDATQERAERDRIKSERGQVEAAYAQREKDCRKRFAVTSCVDEARRDRRHALERLRLEQEVLDEAQRKQRAAQRMDDIRAKVSGEDADRREATARDRRKEKQRAEVLARPSPTGTPPGAASAASAPHAGQTTPADEARHVADYERRQKEAKEHRKAVERRNAERVAQGKAPAKPLPGAASAAASAAH